MENAAHKAAIEFQNNYHTKPDVAVYAPGRVNLIGEHVDYNDGFVLPVALKQRIITLAGLRADTTIRARSAQVGVPVIFDLDDDEKKGRWDDAVRGVVWLLKKQGAKLPGMDLLFYGDVPLEAGLSSSAAFTVSATLCLSKIAGITLSPTALALLAQRVENEFMGVACGVLDQMASAVCKTSNALLLDCMDLSFSHVPMADNMAIVVCHTGITRSLAGSEYNTRRAQCLAGLNVLRRAYPEVTSFRHVVTEMLAEQKTALGQVGYKRLKHVLSENARTQKAAKALAAGDAATFGDLVNQSHESLRYDYEVSCEELDIMVEIARSFPECFGARLVGAGFGGCAIALVQPNFASEFCAHIKHRYETKAKQKSKFFCVSPGPGAGVLDLL